ncbi:MAG: laccase domain-containing protein [Patescibacteria group bacterium]
MENNNVERSMEMRFGDAIIKSPEGGIRYGVFELLEDKKITHGFSAISKNMSFGAEKSGLERRALNVRLGQFLREIGIPTEKQVIMTANLFKPIGNFVIIGEKGLTLNQLPLLREIYGDDLVRSASDYPRFVGSEYAADGIFTNEPGIALEAVSRDCMPIIVAVRSAQKSLTGIVHGGRRQIEAGLGERIVAFCREFADASPEEILIGIGPHIRSCHYFFNRRQIAEDEGGKSVSINEERWGDYLINKSKDVFSLDMEGLLTQELISKGVLPQCVARADLCSYDAQEQSFSAASLRYQSKHNLPPSRMITVALHD